MSKRKTLDQVLLEFSVVHGDRYDYSKVVYVNRKTKVEIVCKEHGSFFMTPEHHASGNNCVKCRAGRSKKRKSHTKYMKECEKKFGNRFTYLSEYEPGDSGRIKVECPIHGSFQILCRVHLKSNYGCPSCASEQMDRGVGSIGCINRKVAEKNKHEIYYVYLLNMWDDVENFLKVGLTKVGSEQKRFNAMRKYYNLEIIRLYELPLDCAFELEQFILSEAELYKPLKKFGGHTECFKSHVLNLQALTA